MARQVLNIGTTANDGTGDDLRSAMDKINDNFAELYAAYSTLTFEDSTIAAAEADTNITLSTSGTGLVIVEQGMTINSEGENSDTKVIAADSTTQLFIDASEKKIGINNLSPTNELSVTGSADFSGSVTVLGNTTLGDSASDRVTIVAEVWGNLIPGSTGYDIGSASDPWDEVHATDINATTGDFTTLTGDLTGNVTGNVTGQLTTSTTIRISNGAFLSLVGTETLTSNRSVNFPNTNGTIIVEHNDKIKAPHGATPASAVGASGDIQGNVAFDSSYIYYCTANYDGSTSIWKRAAISTW